MFCLTRNSRLSTKDFRGPKSKETQPKVILYNGKFSNVTTLLSKHRESEERNSCHLNIVDSSESH